MKGITQYVRELMTQERGRELQVTPLSREVVRLPREAGTVHPSNGRKPRHGH